MILGPVYDLFVVVQSELCPTLCNSTDCSTPAFPVPNWSLLKFMSVELMMLSVSSSAGHFSFFPYEPTV